MSFTYADMQYRIASEMKRDDLRTDSVLSSGSTSSIQAAILSAIAQYQLTRFYFNELEYGSWSTGANQERYATADGVPSDIVAPDTLTIVYSSTRLPLDQRAASWIERRQDGAFKGLPTDFAYYGQKFRLFPIPTGVWTLNLAYWQAVAAPSTATDVGPWMNDAEELIRCAAKRRLMTHVTSDEDVQKMLLAEGDALRVLKAETALRTGTGHIRATDF